jgi:molybdopterin molybdotransferase
MLTLPEAQAEILARVRAADRTETVPLARACGRFAAQGLNAVVDNPAFDNSAMDGYALNSRDLDRLFPARSRPPVPDAVYLAPPWARTSSIPGLVATQAGMLPVLGESSCGSAPQTLTPGTAMRIFTGAPLPAGADTVVMQEDVERDGARARFPQDTRAGDHVRRRGEDFRAGEQLYAPGRRLSAYDLALLSAAGVAEVSVVTRPRALVVATGDELVAPGQPLRPGQIYESNRLGTLLQLEALGAETVDGGTVRDDPAALRALLKDAGDYDFIITSGGASVGDHDLVKQVFAEIGEISFWKVKIKPGKPVAFGRVGARTHFFALPGNPVSSLVTFKLFVEPALYAWHHSQLPVFELPAIATNGFQRKPGRMEFLRARLWSENGELKAEALAGQGSHQIGTLRHTNGFIRIGEDSSGFVTGERVNALPLF